MEEKYDAKGMLLWRNIMFSHGGYRGLGKITSH